MFLKFFRLFHIQEVTGSLRLVKGMLEEIFFMQRFLFTNLLSWSLAATKLLLSMHYFACGWICMARKKTHYGWVSVEFTDERPWVTYFESMYLMTSTISTVGFGDF